MAPRFYPPPPHLFPGTEFLPTSDSVYASLGDGQSQPLLPPFLPPAGLYGQTRVFPVLDTCRVQFPRFALLLVVPWESEEGRIVSKRVTLGVSRPPKMFSPNLRCQPLLPYCYGFSACTDIWGEGSGFLSVTGKWIYTVKVHCKTNSLSKKYMDPSKLTGTRSLISETSVLSGLPGVFGVAHNKRRWRWGKTQVLTIRKPERLKVLLRRMGAPFTSKKKKSASERRARDEWRSRRRT